jgi:hypothetical protein
VIPHRIGLSIGVAAALSASHMAIEDRLTALRASARARPKRRITKKAVKRNRKRWLQKKARKITRRNRK